MPRGQFRSAGRAVSGHAMTLRVGNIDDHPIATAIFQCVLHYHSAGYVWITFRMKGDCGERPIFVERHRRRVDIQRFHIESRTCFKAVNDSFLHFVASLNMITTSGKRDNGKDESGCRTKHDSIITTGIAMLSEGYRTFSAALSYKRLPRNTCVRVADEANFLATPGVRHEQIAITGLYKRWIGILAWAGF